MEAHEALSGRENSRQAAGGRDAETGRAAGRDAAAGHAAVREVAGGQAGVVSRAQALGAGLTPDLLRGLIARGVWQRVHPGVYAVHNGPLTPQTRSWAALLYAGRGAVLGFEAAAALDGLQPQFPRTVDVWVPRRRTVRPQPLLRIHRRDVGRVWHRRPVRTWPEQTAIDLASRAVDENEVVAAVTSAIRAGGNVATLSGLLEQNRRLRWRRLLVQLTSDLSEGVESPLEWQFRHRVHRPHRLPPAQLQVRERLGVGWIRADLRFASYGVRIELDGALAHPGGRTDRDTWRDNEVLLQTGDITLRYRWSHVVGGPCRTAAQVALALRAGGWPGAARRCGPGCSLP